VRNLLIRTGSWPSLKTSKPLVPYTLVRAISVPLGRVNHGHSRHRSRHLHAAKMPVVFSMA
jgi:hypothetical protein